MESLLTGVWSGLIRVGLINPTLGRETETWRGEGRGKEVLGKIDAAFGTEYNLGTAHSPITSWLITNQ